MSRFTWILDPGHGGMLNGVYQTKGKRSPVWSDGSQYFEGVGNREIARKVANELDKLDLDYIFTVEPQDPTDITLTARTNFVNKLPYKKKVLISIHSNGFSKESAHGWEIYTSKGETTSDKFASMFAAQFLLKFPEMTFRKDTRDGDVDKEANFYIIKNTTCPAVLLENFFHTNEKECKEILMSEEGQNKIVDAIVQGIIYIERNA